MRVLLPKAKVEIRAGYGPVFFLAGPTLGGGDWHYRCYGLLKQRLKHFYAAIPQWYDIDHPLYRLRLTGDLTAKPFERQLEWERHYLRIAGEAGCVIFWLPCESREEPRKDGLPYAMDTRGELGEWRGQMIHKPGLRVVIGAEKDFPGLNTITNNFKQALGKDFPIYGSLSKTIEAAVDMTRGILSKAC